MGYQLRFIPFPMEPEEIILSPDTFELLRRYMGAEKPDSLTQLIFDRSKITDLAIIRLTAIMCDSQTIHDEIDQIIKHIEKYDRIQFVIYYV